MHNKEMNLAWQYLEGTQTSVFLTGKAGTGKTTFLRKLRELSPKRMVVLAPTGVAAINAGGQTIHSFFQLPFSPFIPGMKTETQQKYFRMSKEKKNLIRTLDLLVIDEISMVRADLLDAIDDTLRRYRNPLQPFGGVQLLLIGDLQQLPPVITDNEWELLSKHYDTPFFFSSKALRQLHYITIELKHIYRQQDATFINILASIRENRITQETLDILNSRCMAEPEQKDEDDEWIRLTTHNAAANQYNNMRLAMLDEPAKTFRAEITGNYPEYSYPTDSSLILKRGAQVMFVKNDHSPDKLYYNGRIGHIIDFTADGIIVRCKKERAEGTDTILVKTEEWENMKYTIDEATKEIKEETDGTFKQYPLRLAWAITVHKSQGLTFSHAVLDINNSFAHGQVYVALSRCRTLEGLILSAPLSLNSVITEQSINIYMENAILLSADIEEALPRQRFMYFYSLLNEQFSFKTISRDYDHLMRVSYEAFSNSQETYIELLRIKKQILDKELSDVAARFKVQYDQLIQRAGQAYSNDEALNGRILSASKYFMEKLHDAVNPVLTASRTVSKGIRNKATKKKVEVAIDALELSYNVKEKTLHDTSVSGFSVKQYVGSKAKASIVDTPPKTALSRVRRRK